MLTMKMKNGGIILIIPAALCLCLWPTPAWAVQAHGGAEGLVSHQIGHILFFIGLLSLLIRLYQRRLSDAGWREFKVFLWLMILWNILTFSGHWMREIVVMDKFIKGNGHIAGFQATSTFDLIFYATRLDHIFLVPALCFLLMALRRWDHAS